MTQDEIIRMATEVWGYADWKGAPLERLERFAALVAAREREKQAEQSNTIVFDSSSPVVIDYSGKDYRIEAAVLAEREACIEKCKPFGLTGECVAIAIRARGEK